MSERFANIMRKVLGDRRDKTATLREAGFTDEAAAARWASNLSTEPLSARSEPTLTKQIRQARPDLTLATASYIARQAKTRNT